MRPRSIDARPRRTDTKVQAGVDVLSAIHRRIVDVGSPDGPSVIWMEILTIIIFRNVMIRRDDFINGIAVILRLE